LYADDQLQLLFTFTRLSRQELNSYTEDGQTQNIFVHVRTAVDQVCGIYLFVELLSHGLYDTAITCLRHQVPFGAHVFVQPPFKLQSQINPWDAQIKMSCLLWEMKIRWFAHSNHQHISYKFLIPFI